MKYNNIFIGVIKLAFKTKAKDIDEWKCLIDEDENPEQFIIEEGKGLKSLYDLIRTDLNKTELYCRFYVNDIQAFYIINEYQKLFKWSNNSKIIAQNKNNIDFIKLVDDELKIELRSWKRLNNDPDVNSVEEIRNNYWQAWNFLGEAPGANMSSTIFSKRVMWRKDGRCANFRLAMKPIIAASLPKTEEELNFYFNYDRGGMCYINPFAVDKSLHNVVGSADKKSCHLGSMVSRKFPLSGFTECDVKYFDEVYKDNENTAFIAAIMMKNLRPKNSSILPDYRYRYGKQIVKNCEPTGWWQIKINEIDWGWFKDNFEWKEMEITKLLVGRKDYLPKDVVKWLLKLFSEKDKEVKGSFPYHLAKMQTELNYGNSIKRLYYNYSAAFDENGDIVVNEEIVKIKNDKGETIEKKVSELTFEDKLHMLSQRYLPVSLGVWTVSYSRRDIWRAIQVIGPDKSFYGDTDSTKGILDETDCDRLNVEINKDFASAEKHYGFTFPKELGRWCFEYKADIFRIAGRKWYIYKLADGIHFRAAGGNMKVIRKLIEDLDDKIFDIYSTKIEVEGLFKHNKYNFKDNEIIVEQQSHMPQMMTAENEIYVYDKEE